MPIMKRSGNQSQTFCVAPISARSVAQKAAQQSTVRTPPSRLTSMGTSEEETIMPSGDMAAERPIMVGETPCRSRMKLRSG